MTAHEMITPDIRRELRHDLTACRAATLAQLDGVDAASFRRQAHPEFPPLGWHLGHIVRTQARWLLRDLALPHPEFDRQFDDRSRAACAPEDMPEPAEIMAYAANVREAVLDRLETVPDGGQARLWRFVLQYECRHAELIAVLKRLMGMAPVAQPSGLGEPGQVTLSIPAGVAHLGSDEADAMDNERPAHSVSLPAFHIDRYPVTQGQYAIFMEQGGYRERRWWSAEGWAWHEAAAVTAPLFWQEELDDHPVCGVSVHEAEAYCRYAGGRLPTEAEWERAAAASRQEAAGACHPWGDDSPDHVRCNHGNLPGHTSPVTEHRHGRSAFGGDDMLGNVWEWTATVFAPYEGFAPFTDAGSSTPCFDGRHRVLKGGSFATQRWILRRGFRNPQPPDRRAILAGFRLAADA